MRRSVFHAAYLTVAVATSQVATAKKVELQPQSEWALDSDDNSCALVRVFADGKGVTQLEFRQFSPGAPLRVQIVSTEQDMTMRDHMAYRFEPETAWRELPKHAFGYFGVRSKYDGVVFEATILPSAESGSPAPPNDAEALAQLGKALATFDGITVSDAFGDEVSLRTGPLMAPFTELRRCLDRLITKWGFDPFVQQTLSKRPNPVNIEEAGKALLRTYPVRALREGRPAILQVRLNIDDSGATTACVAQGPLPDAEFEQAACKSLMGLRFEPALDSKGMPVASFWEQRVYYR